MTESIFSGNKHTANSMIVHFDLSVRVVTAIFRRV